MLRRLGASAATGVPWHVGDPVVSRVHGLISLRALCTSPVSASSYRRFGDPKTSSDKKSSANDFRTQLEEQLFRAQSSSRRSAGQGAYQRFGPGNGGGRGSSRLNGGSKIILVVAAVGGGIFYVSHLEQVPETGRWRYMRLSPAQEYQLGVQAYRELLQQYQGKILPASHPHSKYVRSVASRIVAALDRTVNNQPDHMQGDATMDHHSHGQEGGITYGSRSSDANSPDRVPKTKWEVFVIDEPKEVNAFVCPGGKIFVFTGILPVCKNADGLATVLGHEVAHQVARHIAEKVSGYDVFVFGGFLMSLIGIQYDYYESLMTLLYNLPNSRKAELEADYLGLKIMSRACFDPQEASKFWTRMTEAEGKSKGGVLENLLSDHPVSTKRMKNMQDWLPEAMSLRDNSSCPPVHKVSAFKSAVGIS